MKSLLSFILVSLLFAEPATTEYVCLPCGQECDQEVYAKPGNCAHCGMELVDKATVKFTQATVEDFCRRIAANPKAIILDVRTSAEFAGTTTDVPSFGHFKNAININVNELERKLDQLAAYKNQEILVYCSHSHRSPRASYLLGTKGFTKVVNMEGGVSTLPVNLSACLQDKFVRH
jgi:rhodanese-related sulfurtransferase